MFVSSRDVPTRALEPACYCAGLGAARRSASPVSISRTTRSATSAVMSAEPTAVGITSTTSAPTSSTPRGDLAHRPEQVDGGHAARLGRPGARREGRVEHVDVDRHVDRPRPPRARARARRPLRMPCVADVVHEEARDPVLGAATRTRPAPASSRADRSARTAPDRRGPPRRGGTSASRASARRRRPPCPVSVCVSKWIEPDRPRRAATAAMSGSVIEWSPPSVTGSAPASTTSPTSRLDRRVRPRRVGGDHRRVAVVDDRQRGERVDARLEVRAGRAGRRPDRARREPRAGTVRDEVVGRRADDRDVDAGEVRRLLRVRRAAEGEEARVVGLVAERAPALVAGRSCDEHLTASGGAGRAGGGSARPAGAPSAVGVFRIRERRTHETIDWTDQSGRTRALP